MTYNVLRNRCGCGVILKHPIKVCDNCHMKRALKAIVANPKPPTVVYLTTSEALAAMRANPGTKYYNHVDGKGVIYYIDKKILVVLVNGVLHRPSLEHKLTAWDREYPNNQLKWYKESNR